MLLSATSRHVKRWVLNSKDLLLLQGVDMGISKKDKVLYEEQRKFEGKFVKAKLISGYTDAPRSISGDLIVTECRDMSGDVLFAYTYTIGEYSVDPESIRLALIKPRSSKTLKVA